MNPPETATAPAARVHGSDDGNGTADIDPHPTAHEYRTTSVPVDGGAVHVGVWEPVGVSDPPSVLMIHGITSSHRAWDLVAEGLTGVRVIAPDLRGRGRSASVQGPAGMAAHADDMIAVLDACGLDRVLVVGHSMGAFVSAVLAARFPERTARAVLIDGGLPLDVPAGLDPDETVRAILGPTAERLAMTFESVGAYVDFWRSHPGFAAYWEPYFAEYFAYDLEGEEPALHPATRYEVAREDTIDLTAGETLVQALAARPRPLHLVTCPRGLFDQTPGLYAPERIPSLLAAYPGVTHEQIDDVNHYTIVMGEQGARQIVPIVRSALLG